MRDAACVMRSLYIAIPDEAADQLRELARREFRAPRQQAAILVIAGLKRAALEPDTPPDDHHDPSTPRHVAFQSASERATSPLTRPADQGRSRFGRRRSRATRSDDTRAGT